MMMNRWIYSEGKLFSDTPIIIDWLNFERVLAYFNLLPGICIITSQELALELTMLLRADLGLAWFNIGSDQGIINYDEYETYYLSTCQY